MSGPSSVYVTLSGLPLLIEFKWPFHSSTAGADFWVLHADVKLGNSEGLHAPVAVNLSATVREVLPSMQSKDVEGPVVNALRKEVDRRQLEFVKKLSTHGRGALEGYGEQHKLIGSRLGLTRPARVFCVLST